VDPLQLKSFVESLRKRSRQLDRYIGHKGAVAAFAELTEIMEEGGLGEKRAGVSSAEFAKRLRRYTTKCVPQHGLNEMTTNALFRAMDVDKSGFLSLAELECGLASLFPFTAKEASTTMFDVCDATASGGRGDGLLQPAEFTIAFRSIFALHRLLKEGTPLSERFTAVGTSEVAESMCKSIYKSIATQSGITKPQFTLWFQQAIVGQDKAPSVKAKKSGTAGRAATIPEGKAATAATAAQVTTSLMSVAAALPAGSPEQMVAMQHVQATMMASATVATYRPSKAALMMQQAASLPVGSPERQYHQMMAVQQLKVEVSQAAQDAAHNAARNVAPRNVLPSKHSDNIERAMREVHGAPPIHGSRDVSPSKNGGWDGAPPWHAARDVVPSKAPGGQVDSELAMRELHGAPPPRAPTPHQALQGAAIRGVQEDKTRVQAARARARASVASGGRAPSLIKTPSSIFAKKQRGTRRASITHPANDGLHSHHLEGFLLKKGSGAIRLQGFDLHRGGLQKVRDLW